MERKQRIDAFGATVLVAFSALLGLNQVLVKLVNEGFAPIFQAGLRSACAFLPVLLIAIILKRRLSISDGSLVPGLITGTFFAAEFILLFQALDYTTVSRASIFFYTMPFWVALAAHFLIAGERLTPVKLAGLALAIAGVALAMASDERPASDKALLGDLMCLLGAMGWAAIALIARTTTLSKSAPEMQLLYQLAVSAPIMLALAFVLGETVREPTTTHYAIFAFQVLAVVSIGFLTWFWILSIYPASDMASFSFLAPVFGVFFGWLVFDEQLTWTILAALTLVAIGIVLVNRKPKRADVHHRFR
ncbi:MAG: DMT family transporter [Pseudomonadota bacterium]